jgi:cytochrome c oxidase subunit 2
VIDFLILIFQTMPSVARLLKSAALALVALAATGCSKAEWMVRQSAMDPKGPVSQVQFDVFMATVWLALVLFVLVGGALVYAVIRYRERAGQADAPPPDQGHGNPLVEIGLIMASIAALVVIAIPTLEAIWYLEDVPAERQPDSKLAAWYKGAVPAEAAEEVLTVDVIGKQWWFRFEYPQLGLTQETKRTVPNELVIPRGKVVRINLRSEDVIHSFWVPKIAGKVDLIPGRRNHLWIQADQAGHYYGQCAEFCGDSHAYMLFRVTVVEPEAFAAWVESQKAPAPEPAPGSLAAKGKQLFAQKTCIMCHRVAGHYEASAGFGPDLARVASRSTLAGAWLDNRSPEAQAALDAKGNTEVSAPIDLAVQRRNLHDWIGSSGILVDAAGKPLIPQDIKPGNRMHYYRMFNVAGLRETKTTLTQEELDAIVEYLMTLK